MKARGPRKRTDADRQSRRENNARSWDSLRGDVPSTVFEALFDVRPQLQRVDQNVVLGLAHIVSIAESKVRRHAEHDGWFSLNSIELEGRFGRGEFNRLNDRYQLFDVKTDYTAQKTRAYRVRPDVRRMVESRIDNLIRTPGAVTKLIGPDGKKRRKVRRWSAARNLQGLSASLVGNARLPILVSVDHEALLWLADELQQLQGADERQREEAFLSLGIDPATDPEYLRSALRDVMLMAKTDVAGHGRIEHDYVMLRTGRLFAEGLSLQSAPKVVKRFALHGLWEYDFSNCHFAIIRQLAGHAGKQCPTITHYLANKNTERSRLAQLVGAPVDEIKSCLIALAYGAPRSVRPQDAIPKEIGVRQARRLYRDSFFKALGDELIKLRSTIVEHHRIRAGVVYNALGLPWKPKKKQSGKANKKRASAAELQAHILQGIEAQALLAMLREFHEDIVLLEHDGFVSQSSIDPARAEAVVQEATGFRLTLEWERIQLPSHVDVRKPRCRTTH